MSGEHEVTFTDLDPNPVDPALVGTGTKRSVGLTRFGTSSHFMQADQLTTLCGAITAYNTNDDDWVSCTRCLTAARKATS